MTVNWGQIRHMFPVYFNPTPMTLCVALGGCRHILVSYYFRFYVDSGRSRVYLNNEEVDFLFDTHLSGEIDPIIA